MYLAVYSPASVNVMPFDPLHGSDQARAYATKYCSKPEKAKGCFYVWFTLWGVADPPVYA